MLKKTMHFYWGNRTMSFLRYMSIHSFAKLNPKWETVLVRRREPVANNYFKWDEKPDFLHFHGKDCTKMLDGLDITIKYLEDDYPDIVETDLPDLHISDLLQWRILSEDGGVCSDTDVLYFRPIDYGQVKNVDVGLVSFSGNPKPMYVPTSFVLGRPNRFFSIMFNHARQNADYMEWESCGSIAIKSAFGDMGGVHAAFPELNVVRLPSHIVFPFAETERMFVEYANMMFYQNVEMPRDSIGIHWYGSGAISQHFNNKITRNNYKEFNNTICRIVGDVI